jgi:hypothetical protein
MEVTLNTVVIKRVYNRGMMGMMDIMTVASGR